VDDDPYPSRLFLELTENSIWKPDPADWECLERASFELARLVGIKGEELSAGVHFCATDEMKEFHLRYLNDPTVTDVMSFDGEGDYLGDVVACVEVARENGEDLGHGLWPELMFYVLHGLLHNMGYDDRTEKEKETMLELQRKALRAVGVEVTQ